MNENNKMTQRERKIIETKLKYFPHIKAKIKGKLSEVIKDDDFQLQGMDYQGVFTGNTNDFYSEIEDYLLDQEEAPKKLLDWIAERNKIQAALDSLTHKENLVVKYYYFEDLTARETGIRLTERDRRIYKGDEDFEPKEYTRKKVEDMKTKIVKKLYDLGLAEIDGGEKCGEDIK